MREVRPGMLAALFQHPDHQRVVRAVDPRRGVAVPGLVRPPAGLQQEPARDRRRPGGLLDVGRLEERPARRFNRLRRGAAALGVRGVVCSDQWRLILLRGVACHVMRAIPFRSRVSVNAWRLRSKSTVQAFGLPAFLLNHMPGTVFFRPVWR